MVSWSPISLDNADFSSLGMGWLCFLVFPIASLRCVFVFDTKTHSPWQAPEQSGFYTCFAT
ncbi:hypothetical protein VVMO6_04390 [Vibrio vulnificus MO6-24/O]|nr:hypothetical protein VVMO6_04390 [Vibrio vulnificus MO6-24/O]